ncbi:unnamed protein product, partial [Amoebophrya sp. A120]
GARPRDGFASGRGEPCPEAPTPAPPVLVAQAAGPSPAGVCLPAWRRAELKFKNSARFVSIVGAAKF